MRSTITKMVRLRKEFSMASMEERKKLLRENPEKLFKLAHSHRISGMIYFKSTDKYYYINYQDAYDISYSILDGYASSYPINDLIEVHLDKDTFGRIKEKIGIAPNLITDNPLKDITIKSKLDNCCKYYAVTSYVRPYDKDIAFKVCTVCKQEVL